MARFRNSNKSIDDSGLSNNTRSIGGRLANKDGSMNIRRTGLPFLDSFSLYHTLLKLGSIKFLITVFAFYTALNVFFACVYVGVGIEHLQGTDQGGPFWEQFQQAFFFSSQTLTTVGYGHISPHGLLANTVASIESFMGIMSFALVTGLFFARFSRPKAFLKFSENFIVAPFNGGRALMLRVASATGEHLSDAEARITCAIQMLDNGVPTTKYFILPLELAKINNLALTWTIVHPIDEQSPLFDFDKEGLLNSEMEIMVMLKAFDGYYSNIVQQRTSYTVDELVYGAKFRPAYRSNEAGDHTLLEMDKLNDFELVEL